MRKQSLLSLLIKRLSYVFILYTLIFIVTIISIDFYLLKTNSSINLQKELNSISSIIKQYYISGDLASLRNFLDSWSKLNSIEGILTDTNDTTLWQSAYTSDDYVKITSELMYINKVKIGTIQLFQDLTEIKKIKSEQYLKLSMYIFFITASFIILFYFVTKYSLKPIREIFNTLKNEANNIGFNFKNIDSDELTTIKLWFQELSGAWAIEKKNSTEAAKAITFTQIATQVAHDIRSPLSALNMITSTLDEISEDKRVIIRSSIQRINDIANDLLKKGKHSNYDIPLDGRTHPCTELLLSSVLESIVSEKRVQFRNKIKIQISLNATRAYGIFVAIHESEFKRVLSNIINNAVEAIDINEGLVNLIADTQENSATIKITDTGPGIPKIILEKLGKESISFGKVNSDSGNGLGVLHAKNTIESFGGNFSIESDLSNGTTVTISLNISATPSWFLVKLEVSQDETIIICDDDSSIHSLWKERFSRIPNIKILNFSTLKELELWLSNSKNYNTTFKLLIDFEFSNEDGDGIDLILKYNLNKKSVLVTSHFEERNIISKCITYDIKQIPKNLSGLVPIQLNSVSVIYDVVILENDEALEQLWKFAAIQCEKNILFLNSQDQLFQNLTNINTCTPIYIDANLPNVKLSEEIVVHLNKLGYKNIYLTARQSTNNYNHLHFLKGVVGKTPKFE